MWISDMPDVPPQNVPVMIAEANQAQPSDVTTTRTLGVCFPTPNDNYSADNGLVPIKDAQAYLRRYEHQTVKVPAIITILQQPKHGILRLITDADRGTLFSSSSSTLKSNTGLYAYLPDKGYVGKDRATVLVDFGDIKVKVEYFFQAFSGVLGNTGWEERCKETGIDWKISTNLFSDGANTITSTQSPTTRATGTTVVVR